MTIRTHKFSLLAIAVSAALAACGGGGGGDSTSTPAGTAAAGTGTGAGTSTGTGTGTSTGTGTGTSTGTSTGTGTGTLPTAGTGTSSGSASDTTGAITPGLPPAPIVPTANIVVNTVASPTYNQGPPPSQAFKMFQLSQDYRQRMRTEEEGAFGVGLLAQRPGLDTAASAFLTSLPNLSSANATDRQAAAASAAQQLTALGYPVSVTVAASTANSYSISAGDFCAKAIFSSVPGVELASAGMRYLGLAVPETAGGTCIMIGALESAGTWQLPPTGSSSVYPFPGKLLTLTRFWGDYTSLGFASQPGHAVFASVASVDALPFAVPGAGSGAAIAASAITLQEFTLVVRDTNTPVSAKILVPNGMARGAGVTAEDTTAFRFPTSIALVPLAPLNTNTAYKATFRATVNGRSVQRTWEFTTAES